MVWREEYYKEFVGVWRLAFCESFYLPVTFASKRAFSCFDNTFIMRQNKVEGTLVHSILLLREN